MEIPSASIGSTEIGPNKNHRKNRAGNIFFYEESSCIQKSVLADFIELVASSGSNDAEFNRHFAK